MWYTGGNEAIMYKIDNYNRNQILSEYIDSIVNNLSVTELKSIASNCLLKEKDFLSDETLEQEIMRHFPSILIKYYVSENSSRSSQYHKSPEDSNYCSLVLE
jgi:hypothetical protein